MLVEPRDQRPPDPVWVVGYGEVCKGRFDPTTGCLGIAAEPEKGEAKAFSNLEQRIGPVPGILDLAR